MTTIAFTTNNGTAGGDTLGIRANYDGETDILTADNAVNGLGGNDSISSTLLPIAIGDQEFYFTITLDGGTGDDNITGYNATDILIGGAGNDALAGVSGSQMSGGSGVDTLNLDSHLSAANLTLSYAAQAGASVVLSDGSTIRGFEKFFIQSGAGDDTLDLSGDANALDSNFQSGEGNDTLVVNSATQGAIAFSGSVGVDRLIADLSALSVDITLETFGSGGQLTAGGLTVFGSEVENFDITAGSGNDSLRGGNFADDFSGGAGADSLAGGGGNDVLDGGGDDDRLEGGAGKDRFLASAGADTVQGGAGGDGLDFSAFTTAVSADMAAGLATYADGSGTASFSSIATLTGGAGADDFTGDGRANLLSGLGGKDTLDGAGGNDTLTGGLSRDSLTGGLGLDVFDYNATAETGAGANSRDIITDFVVAEDRIDLSGIDAIAGGGASNDVFAFLGTAAFTAAGQVRVVQSGADTLVEINTSGAGGAEAKILLLGVTASTLTEADFVL